MYLRNSAGNLTELYDEYGHNWYKTKLQTNITIDRGSQLAALSRLDDGLLKIQVLASKSDGGVKMAFLNGTLWNELDSVNGMESVLPLSPIAATQAGYVYTLGEGHQVVEWVRNNSSPPTFLRLGTINTTNV
ncbi:uncharacterized protein K452DRAFT_363237 [Aplosporella prunicola CBS 121167]|uniref:Fucose-specific lectin n=1 Tax=Aplosporella prunicola CBS 121167 TaxID=1176127 RepID=A0A6A6AWJ5_9PEZI|nr:uncharacterized protein K452DRAFT_363237 [Aplosporella prunicola CBS 121167]KAF2135314.1 hypothetical protein K452DRAFT_363237 [Aplosporella prunicola CBS 121167]